MAERKTQYNRVKKSKPLPDSVELEALKNVKQEAPKEEYETTPVAVEITVTAKTGLNVRKQPSKNAPILKVLPNGFKFVTNKIENGWAYISTEKGWVMTEFTSYKK